MPDFPRNDWTVEHTIRTGIVLISFAAILLMASLSWKLANDAREDTLRELIEISEETARTRVRDLVLRQVNEFSQIATSNVIATALTDSSGRESYLAPFLQQRTVASGLSFGVFDYRGRMLMRTGDLSFSIIPPKMATPRADIRDLDFDVDEQIISFEAPIRFFADNKPIGFLVGRIMPSTITSDTELISSKFYSADVTFYVAREAPPDRNHVKLFEAGDKTLIAAINLTPQTNWLDTTLKKVSVLGMVATATILLASLVVARITAHRINSPLRKLTRAVAKLRRGEHVSPLSDKMPREIETLSSALFLAFEERSDALNKLQNLAHYDNLTGTLSRAYFDHQARNLLQISLRNKASATMIYLDLDRFKEINDTYGHDAGDILLTTVTMRIHRRMRTSDLFGRRGGDEFVLLLSPLGDHGDIRALAFDLARMITMPVDIGSGLSVSVGVSMGAAVFPEDANTFNELITAADCAMYEAKKLGRGQLAFATGQTILFNRENWTPSIGGRGNENP